MRAIGRMLAATLVAGTTQAQETVEVDPITVIGHPDRYAEHADAVAPRLVYQAKALERLEPVSVGEMLKRLPGVVFSSDAGGYQAPQLRGIGPEYTQILIDGQRVPGAENDRGVLVDRIPPEMVERIEILRSPTADLDAQGVGGTINIVLKSGAGPSGDEIRTDLSHTDDGTLRGGGYLGYTGSQGALSWLVGLDLRRRYEPRTKHATVFDPAGRAIESRASEEDRDGTDTGLNGQLSWRTEPGSLDLHAFRYGTRNDTDLEQRLFDPGSGGTESSSRRYEHDDAAENTWGLDLRARFPRPDGGTWSASAGLSQTHVDRDKLAGEITSGGEIPDQGERLSVRDRETRAALARSLVPSLGGEWRLGVQAARKTRDADASRGQNQDGVLVDVRAADGSYAIKERRLDGFVQDRWPVGTAFTLDGGLRAERSWLDQAGFDADGARVRASDSRLDLSPNLHALWDASDDDRLRLSLARTLRRPNFNQLVPFRLREDQRFVIGNPRLGPERALGADLGYERRLGAGRAVLGLNLFFRNIENLIEQRRVAADTVSPTNVGTGRVWGVEFDGTWTPELAGLFDLSLSANLSLLDSSVRDPFTGEQRRFQLQPAHVLNLGLEQGIGNLQVCWGANLTLNGALREQLANETTHNDYGAELEAFIEYSFAERFVLRLTGSDLLDSRLTETTRSYDGERPDAALKQVLVERESLGPRLMLTLRAKF